VQVTTISIRPKRSESFRYTISSRAARNDLVPGDFRAEIGERIWLSPNVDLVHIFSDRTGRSLSQVVKKD
jgi:hypothetical protein